MPPPAIRVISLLVAVRIIILHFDASVHVRYGRPTATYIILNGKDRLDTGADIPESRKGLASPNISIASAQFP